MASGALNILKSLMGTHSQSGKGAGAASVKFPAMDGKTKKSYKDLKTELEGIQKAMHGIATSSGASAELNNLAKNARKLQPLYKAIEDVKDAEENYLKLMKDSTATIHDQVKAYNKLAAAKKLQNQIGNEQSGMMGRMKNVMGGFGKANILMAIGMGILRDASKIAQGASEGFDVMARSGQALGKSFEELGASTTKYMFNLNKASIVGAAWGHTAEDSKKSFQLLVQTMGGTDDAIDRVTENFGEFAKIARYSGMALGDAAAYADKNWKRLGKTIEESKSDIAAMGLNTANLNDLFGEGSIDSKEYAQAVSDLSFSAGNYNQNTKFLIESLSREVAIQLSLGKSREAAMESAKKNLEKAGQVNLAGVQMLAGKLNAEFKDREATLEEMNERFGSEGEVMFELMKGGISQDELLTLEALAKGSSEMQGQILNLFRDDAAKGGTKGLQTGAQTYGEHKVMQLQEKRRDVEFQAVKDADTPEKLAAALESIFKGHEGSQKQDIDAFAKALREDPKSNARNEFDKVIAAIKPKAGKKDPVDEFLSQVKGEAVVRTMAAMTTLPGALADLPVSIAIALAAQKAAQTGVGGKAWKALKDFGSNRMQHRMGIKPLSKGVQARQEALGEEYDKLKLQKDPKVKGQSRGEWIRTTDAGRAGARKRAAEKESYEEFTVPTSSEDQLPVGDVGGEMRAAQAATEAGEDPAEARKEYWATHSGGVQDFTTPNTPQATKPPSQKVAEQEPVFDHQSPGAGETRLAGVMSRDGNGTIIIEVEGGDRTFAQWSNEASASNPPA